MPRNRMDTRPDFRYGFLMYSELRRKVMQRTTSSSHCVEVMTWGRFLICCQPSVDPDSSNGGLPKDELVVAYHNFEKILRETPEYLRLFTW